LRLPIHLLVRVTKAAELAGLPFQAWIEQALEKKLPR